jgi:hypothetical protein
MFVFSDLEQIVHVNQPRPHHRYRKHAKPDAQIPADNVQELRLAAVRVEKKKLANPSAMYAFTKFKPGSRKGSVRQRQRTWESKMLVRLADRHHRQDERGAVGRHQFDRARDNTCIDRCIDTDGE